MVDMHHHIGAEKNDKGEVTARNLNPREADGSYDRIRSILSGNAPYLAGLTQQLQDQTRFKYFHDPAAGPLSIMPPMMEYFADENPSLQGDFKDTFAIDLVTAFPMHDSFRSEKGTEYRSSNERLGRLVNTFPHSMRFAGFGRVNPKDGKKAGIEVERIVKEDGLCGLKLHPKSESFTINTPEVKEIVKTAAMFGLPVIFHTDWTQHLDDIQSVADQILLEMAAAGRAEDFSMLRMIVGHCGFYFDPHMFEILAHPCIFGELSGLHGEGPARFIKMARHSYDSTAFTDRHLPALIQKGGLSESQVKLFQQATARDWSRKFLFGTDFPFLNQNGVIETLTSLFSKELDLEPGELQAILGVNALSIIPPKYQSPRLKHDPSNINFTPARRFPGRGLIRQTVRRLLELMKAGWTIAGLEYLVDDGPVRRVRTRQAVVTLVRKDGVARSFLFTILSEGGLETIHPLSKEMFPGVIGRCVRIQDMKSGEAHINALLGSGPWNDENLTVLETLSTVSTPT
jgi:predicted TIM-barrel fold metal-dependent hydrolase